MFGVLNVVMTNNGTQFADRQFLQLLLELNVEQKFTFVEHPSDKRPSRGTNQIILWGLRRRIKKAKGTWVEQLQHALWAYQITPHSATRETQFRMVYGIKVVIPVEIEESTSRIANLNLEKNEGSLITKLDLIEERKEVVDIRDVSLERNITTRYNKKVIPCTVEKDDLVLQQVTAGGKNNHRGKLIQNWGRTL